MPIQLGKYFKVPAAELRRRGVLNSHVGIDDRLFVDPNLLKTIAIPEFKNARADLESYFAPVIKLLKASKKEGDVAWEAAHKRLTFREEHGTALGYANAGAFGKGVGPEMAALLTKRAKEILDLGIDATEMFELIGLFQERFGADLLSDMAVSILKERFLNYTQRVTSELNLQPQRKFSLHGKGWILPIHPYGNRALVFVPAEILTPLPVALDRSEISDVAAFNEEVRQQWNAIVSAASKDKRAVSKGEIREMLLSKPKNLADLIEVYRKAAGRKYDFDKDPDGILSWEFLGRAAAEGTPLKIDIKHPKNMEELRAVLSQIIGQFKRNIEENKLYQVLYNEDHSPRREIFAQRLFYSTADTYCEANDVDLSREPDAGNGPVDFKLSTGYHGRILVEVKKSNNPDLLHGFETQLPAYQDSEGTEESVYLILRVTEGDTGIKNLLALQAARAAEGKKVPQVIVIDARQRPPASKR